MYSEIKVRAKNVVFCQTMKIILLETFLKAIFETIIVISFTSHDSSKGKWVNLLKLGDKGKIKKNYNLFYALYCVV